MKKIYLFAIALSTGLLSFGQALQQKMPKIVKTAPELTNKPVNNLNNKAVGSLIYSNDFDNPADWNIDNDGQGGGAFGWSIDDKADGWFFTRNGSTQMNSTSGGNYAELANGTDAVGGGDDSKIGVVYTMTTSDSIDLISLGGTGAENAVLEFEQTGARFNDVQEILISTNGTDFTKVGDNSDKQIRSGGGGIYPNPDLKYVDLSSFLDATTAQSVWIRFRWTTSITGSMQVNSWRTYGWAIDDIKIRTKPDNNLIVETDIFGVHNNTWGINNIRYYTIPTTQVAPVIFSADVSNLGINDASDAILNVDISGAATATVTSVPKNISAGVKDTLFTTSYAIPAVEGLYNFSMEVTSDSIDDIPGDNVLQSQSFQVVAAEGIYARDTYSSSPSNDGGYNYTVSPPSEDFEAGNLYEIFQDQKVGGIDVFVGTNSKEGCVIDVVLYEYNAPTTVSLPFDQIYLPIERSAAYTVETKDIGQIVSLKLPKQPELKAGTTYFAAVHGWGSNNGTIPEFFYGTSGRSPEVDGPIGPTSRLYYPSMTNPTVGLTTVESNTPMVRLNFDLTVGINDVKNNTVEYSVYPNPSTDVFNINLNSDISNTVNLTVTDVVGKVVINKTIAVSGKTLETISLADYSKGIYFLTVNRKTTKLIVR